MKYYFLPPHLSVNDLTIHLTGSLPASGNTPVITENAFLLFSYLSCKLVSLNGANNINGYTQIHSDKLEKMLGKTYYNVLDILLVNNYLEVKQYNEHGEYFADGYYSENKKIAKSYRIHPRLLSTEKLYKKASITNKRMITKMKDMHVEYKAINEYYRNYVLGKMKQTTLLDTPECRAVIRQVLDKQGLQAVDTYIILDFYNNPISAPYIIDHFGFRVHTALTSLSKVLRPFIRFDDDLPTKLVELDIVNSQLFFLGAANSKLIKKFAPECSEAIPYFQDAESTADFIQFQQMTVAGTIYEYIQEQYQNTYGVAITRDQAKTVCYTAMFCSYVNMNKGTIATREIDLAIALFTGGEKDVKLAAKRLENKKAYELFKSLFPSIWQLFYQIKRLDWQFGQNKEKKVKKYANNCLLAQRIESGIIYTRIVKALIAAGITDVLTVHDAIVVKDKDERKARGIIKREMRALNLNPRLN